MKKKKKSLTFKTILKDLACKKSRRCGRLGLARAWGRAVFSSTGQGLAHRAALHTP